MFRVPPTALTAEDDAIDALTELLGGGRSSRFYEAIVRQQQAAVNISAFAGQSRGPRLLRIVATPAPGKPVDALEKAIYEQIDRLETGTIEPWELEKVRNAARRQFVGRLQSSLNRAVDLAEFALYVNDPGQINKQWDRIDKFTVADVQKAARQYLTKENRSVIVTTPKAAAGRGGK